MSDNFSYFPKGLISNDGKDLTPAAFLFLILLSLAFFIPGMMTLPPTDRDEASFAQATKQMIETGDYVDIRLQDKPRYQKPIGIYWLQAASVKIFNPQHLNEIWAYRIPSLAGATIAVLMTAALGSLLFGPIAGFLAALMMAGCVILNTEARLAKTDAALLGCIMLMQYALARAFLNKRMNMKIVLLFWTAFAAGILIKGPMILLVLFSTLLWLRLANKNLAWFNSLKPWFGLGYTLLLVAPWFVAIMLQSHGQFASQSAGHDFLGKIWNGQSRGIMPPGMHLLIFPVAFFPFSLFALLAIPDTWGARKKAAVQFCIGWIVPTWIIFELSLTKLPHYTMVTYPAIAMLAARALHHGYISLREETGRWVVMPTVALWLMIGVGFALVSCLIPYLIDQKQNTTQIAAAVFCVITLNISLFLLFKRKGDSVALLTLGSLVFMASLFGDTLPSLQNLWASRHAVQAAQRSKPCEHLHLISSAYNEPSLIFLAGTQTQIEQDAEIAARKFQEDPCAVALVDDKHDEAFRNFFDPSDIQPAAMEKIAGLNLGSGRKAKMILYSLPRNTQ